MLKRYGFAMNDAGTHLEWRDMPDGPYCHHEHADKLIAALAGALREAKEFVNFRPVEEKIDAALAMLEDVKSDNSRRT
jgi:hypothetical protein